MVCRFIASLTGSIQKVAVELSSGRNTKQLLRLIVQNENGSILEDKLLRPEVAYGRKYYQSEFQLPNEVGVLFMKIHFI